MSHRYYFDWAATAIPVYTPVDTPWGNPSSLHSEGRAAHTALEDARRRCAAVLNVPSERLFFTSGATESNNIVLSSFLLRQQNTPLLYSAIEHSSIRETAALLKVYGKQMGIIGVEQDGRISRTTVIRAFEKYQRSRFAAIMAVNNEVGSIMDMADLVRAIREYAAVPVHIHSDIVQAVGKIPVALSEWDIDSAVLSAHKIGGPRGIGLLYLRKPLEVLFRGGGQEQHIRPGTENVAGAVALAACLEQYVYPETLKNNYEQAVSRNAYLISFLKTIPRCSLIPADRQAIDPRFSPYILHVAFEGIPGEVLVRALDDAGFAVSTGSACSVTRQERPVLAAMGINNHLTVEGIRISQGWLTTKEDIEALCTALQKLLYFL
ncbi:MAG: cysteine desulfurase [Treponema sp.]|nr:cysteine desulfurase [Treponema sp.]